MTTDPRSVTLAEQIECVTRELGYRRHVYERRVANGKMTPALSERELSRMTAVLYTLQRIAGEPGTPQPNVPYREFCRHPNRCAGLSACPRDPCCCD